MELTETFAKQCPMCGDCCCMTVPVAKMKAYEMGGYVQDVFPEPEYNPAEREFIKLGTCLECQKKIFRTNYESERIVKLNMPEE